MLVRALPKWSTNMTQPVTRPPATSGMACGRRTGSCTSGPRRSGATPPARLAATGAKTSRAWKVRETGWRNQRSSTTAKQRAPGSRSAHSRMPLSGPTKLCPRAATTRARRPVPTPGSTTARWTLPSGKSGAAASSRNAARAMCPGGTSCVRSTTCASGQTWYSAPCTTPTNQSCRPKSEVKVMMGRGTVISPVRAAPARPSSRRPRAAPGRRPATAAGTRGTRRPPRPRGRGALFKSFSRRKKSYS